jgi:hypothetical protein
VVVTAREWLDAVEVRANAAEPHAGRCDCVTCLSWRDVPALVAAVRAVLALADRAESTHGMPLFPFEVRAAIDTHLGGAS